jgi:hypothetical protein
MFGFNVFDVFSLSQPHAIARDKDHRSIMPANYQVIHEAIPAKCLDDYGSSLLAPSIFSVPTEPEV